MIHDDSKKIDFFMAFFGGFENALIFAPSSRENDSTIKLKRALSSVGSERLPYKQRVGGSNPSAPTY